MTATTLCVLDEVERMRKSAGAAYDLADRWREIVIGLSIASVGTGLWATTYTGSSRNVRMLKIATPFLALPGLLGFFERQNIGSRQYAESKRRQVRRIEYVHNTMNVAAAQQMIDHLRHNACILPEPPMVSAHSYFLGHKEDFSTFWYLYPNEAADTRSRLQTYLEYLLDNVICTVRTHVVSLASSSTLLLLSSFSLKFHAPTIWKGIWTTYMRYSQRPGAAADCPPCLFIRASLLYGRQELWRYGPALAFAGMLGSQINDDMASIQSLCELARELQMLLRDPRQLDIVRLEPMLGQVIVPQTLAAGEKNLALLGFNYVVGNKILGDSQKGPRILERRLHFLFGYPLTPPPL